MAKTTSVILGERFERFVSEQVESGAYATQSEVIREALRLLERRKARHARELQIIDEGEASGISPLTHEEIFAEAIAKARAREAREAEQA